MKTYIVKIHVSERNTLTTNDFEIELNADNVKSAERHATDKIIMNELTDGEYILTFIINEKI